jgi:redox-sensitive bicupin YhaK (pirin superfamily)
MSDTDGLQTLVVRLGANAELTLPTPRSTSGRSYCVVSGELHVDGADFAPRSLGWSEPGDADVVLTAGDGGAAVLVMDFPKPPSRETHLAEAMSMSGPAS